MEKIAILQKNIFYANKKKYFFKSLKSWNKFIEGVPWAYFWTSDDSKLMRFLADSQPNVNNLLFSHILHGFSESGY
jgi:hypothetical protein